ncbi:LuxR C-terminal-related transcriptional regulator [Paenibacillus algorifonticola]
MLSFYIISESTVKKHLTNIFRKWDIKSRTQLIIYDMKIRKQLFVED